MKLAEHQNKLETNVQNETQNFGIGDASVVIEILRNRLYENKVQTLVQEYICNARDAMREVGKGNDFEVTIPTHFNPVFKVRDFGPGISPERMSGVFILYGASTKRGTNNQTGGFGIGAKSAWSYTDSFTIITTVDGVRRSYVAHTGVNNNGRLDLVSTESTTEKNGTEIQVAVQPQDLREFRDAVMRAIYFWEKRPTLKGTIDAPALVKGESIGIAQIIDSNLIPSYVGLVSSRMLAVIDGVPYDISEKLLNKCPTLKKLQNFVTRSIVLTLGNGVVEVSASRESIADSEKTKEALEKIAHKLALEIKTHVAAKFNQAKGSIGEYIKMYISLKPHYTIESGFAKYKDYNIERDELRSDLLSKVMITKIHCLAKYGGARIEKITKQELHEDNRKIPLNIFERTFFTNKRESKIIENKRVRHYFDGGPTMLYLIEPLPSFQAEFDQVVADLKFLDMNTLTYPILPKEQRIKVTREQTAFCIHTFNSTRFDHIKLADNTQKWFYVPIDKAGNWLIDRKQCEDLNYYFRQNRHNVDVKICGLAGRALNMVKGDANFSPLKDWLDKYKPSRKDITFAKSLKSKNRDCMDLLKDIKDIKDAELADVVTEYEAFGAVAGTDGLPGILLQKVNEEKEVKDFVVQDEKAIKLIKRKYPLLEKLSAYELHSQREELVHYVNAKYKIKE